MLVLCDPGIVHMHTRVVDLQSLLVVASFRLMVLLFESQRTVLQLGHAQRRVVRINRAGEHEELVLRKLILNFKKVGGQTNGDVGVLQQHVLKYPSVPMLGQCLILIREVTVVCVETYRNSHEHRRVQLSRELVPLFLGVVLEDLLIQFRACSRQSCLLAVLRVVILNSALIQPSFHFTLRVDVGIKEHVHCGLRRGDGYELAIHSTLYSMLVRHPLTETIHVLPHTVVYRVKQMHTILADSKAVLVQVVKAVAANVISFINYQGLEAQLG
mmetsp:Transcript_34558/g.66029  ORF Transcript_34558/g.66029 Transcript_34558/m.66029 type:complete len:271 (-) Transcript_34558:201-1013(-)